MARGSLSRPGWESTAGSNSRNAKLTELDALAIYRSQLSESQLAKKYGVSKSTIHGIKSGRRWQHVTRGASNQ